MNDLNSIEYAQTHKMMSLNEMFQQAAAHHQAGRYAEAEELYFSVLQVAPRHPDANHNLGLMAMQLNKAERGLPYLQAAWEADPSTGQYWLTLAECLLEMGHSEDARLLLEEAIRRGIQSPQVQQLLMRTIEGYPVSVAAYPWKASPSTQEIDGLAALFAEGEYKDAATLAHVMTERFPLYGFGWKVLGAAFKQMGRIDDALVFMQKAAELSPNDVETHNNLGITLKSLNRVGEAETSYRRALQINADYAEAHYNLGITLLDLGRLDEAKASFRQALQITPDHAESHINFGTTLKEQGRLDEAEASYRRALQIKPNSADAHSSLLFLYGYHALINPHDYLANARNWEQDCVPLPDAQAASHRVFGVRPLAGRRLRVGYVSGDYHQHAVSYFIEQLFAHHDRTRIELFAYSTQARRDAITERLQALTEHWVLVAGITDSAIRDRIEADGIDVLIDLSGHTAHNRLMVFARRAAPVQVHYLGYFASTGLTEMDYWIGDETLTPQETDSHFSERIWRLPRVWVSYEGKAEAPLSNWQPSRDGTVWLGSFNYLGKLTPVTLALWAKLLHALPEGKLLLKTKGLSEVGNRQRILDAMVGHGISLDRIELQDGSATPGWSAHMAYYDRLDIALDPVGALGGGTTTCDALWMGVPVITLEGDRMASRMTASMLTAIGYPEWVARSEAEYIDKAVALIRDVEHRKALRYTQRNRMAASPLCDAKDLVMHLEHAYFEMLERRFLRKTN